ncbi:ATP-dependent Clp protease adaptor protein ClpS family protein [Theileria parva strain Muguga]|uniref:ATP-dependent Clp protease adaptor protein ClpS family protein n=1 Tax=Theileria parva strain Muguga TaxID=333668 RepID=UPI001C620510|nr:ATP-dependent Clp protease adaptor protein ClpS family protein [Theileria parva strain Muguga]EAN34207.2 ATP-dependent Clp protease adaptor protein ClpS family protein [Theileria parva strain Muguga]
MQFFHKILSFTCAFVIFIQFSLAYTIRSKKFLFIYRIGSKLPKHINILHSEPSPMLRPVRKPESETSKSAKVHHERLRETVKQLKEKEVTQTSPGSKEEREKEVNSWRVILYNDDIHNFMYVTESISKCVPQLPLARAHLITLEAHKNGQAEIIRTWKDKAEQYCRELQKFGLTVCTINDMRG